MQVLIWNVRTSKGIDLCEVSRKTNISKSTLNNYENGKTCPTLESLELIAKALECKMSDLYESEYK